MALIVLCVYVDAGRGNVRMSQVVTHDFEIHVVTLMGPRRMTHPVGRGLLHMSSCRLMVRATRPQTHGGFAKDILDQFVHATAPHGAGTTDERHQ